MKHFTLFDHKLLQGVSGGHLNPAVTIALAVSGKLKNWKRNIPAYLLGQYLGSFCGAAVVFGIYHGKNNMAQSKLFLKT